MSTNCQPDVTQFQFTWALKEYDDKLQSLKSEFKESQRINEVQIAEVKEYQNMLILKLAESNDKQSLLEARVKELEDEVKFLKTLPPGLMETLGYKKM
jgi:uncharacterized protein YydD (DUF2326 family)